MPQTYQTNLWRLELPDTWKVQGSGEHALFFRPDGIGQLQVHGSDTVGRHDLPAYARDHSPPGTAFSDVTCGRFHGVAGVRIDGNTVGCTWWLVCRCQLVYAAYEW